jgi:Flp pilus assembly protein TadB
MQSREFADVARGAVDLMAKVRMAVGVALIAAGVLVAVYPQILVILLSSLIVAAGLGTLASGWRIRRRVGAERAAPPRYQVHDALDR